VAVAAIGSAIVGGTIYWLFSDDEIE